jgi:hypothetical protein
MKPLCDHPSYCKADPRSVYIGQQYHIAHKPHRDINSYFPPGWDELKGKFPQIFCTFTGPHGGTSQALCTTGAGHSWQKVTGNREVLCAAAPPYKKDPPFQGELGEMNMADKGLYKFQRVRTSETSGYYDEIMIKECDKVGMKPLCDHPSYCKNDPNSVYMGQAQHVAHKPHRDIDSYFPSGWSDLKSKFPASFCTYTAHHGSKQRSLCSQGAGHSWQAPSFGYQDIMCAIAPPYKRDDPFQGQLGSKNGADAGLYKFQRIRAELAEHTQIMNYYDQIMVKECAKVDMKPLCDHPSYCKGDSKSVYLGQQYHIAHKPHRDIDSYFPTGWAQLKSKFPTTFCTYTGPHGGTYNSLCTTGGGHSWQRVTANKEIMCAEAPPYKQDPQFQGELGSMNGGNAGMYKFQRVRTFVDSGNYDDIMISECDKVGMKPLCDHPSYCRNDPKSAYIGQQQHIAHKPHRDINSYFPSGWNELKTKFPDYFCTYTAHHGSSAQSLCTTGGGHSWQKVTGNREIMCAKTPPYVPDKPFAGELGSRQGSQAGTYKFQRIRVEELSGNYDTIMENACNKIGMKPLCDHPSYCANDPKAAYIGQAYHIAHKPHRDIDSYFPSGWSQMKTKFPSTFCTYTGPHGSNARTLCTTGGSHSWQAVSGNREIMCVKAPPYKPDPPFSGALGSRNGVPSATYTFQRVKTEATSGSYQAVMPQECAKIGMKPLCDHPSYCRNDQRSIYIGQDHHIAHRPHFNHDGYFPSGWSQLKGKFSNTFCTYCAQASVNALCTRGASHFWQSNMQLNLIMCVKKQR